MNEHFKKVSCIIPCYNEGTRVLGVIAAVLDHPLVEEVIVVDDGSEKKTKELLEKQTGITLISYAKNRGKSHALMMGLMRAKNNMVLLLDSDLLHLTPEYVTRLIEPVQMGGVDMTLSLRKNSLGIFKKIGLDFVSGERVFDKRILGNLDELKKLPGFGFEVHLNRIAVVKHLRLRSIYLENLITPRKHSKFGLIRGLWGDSFMIVQLLSVAGIFGVFHQFYWMKRRCS